MSEESNQITAFHIRNIQVELRRIEKYIEAMAREMYYMRKGKPLNHNYGFDCFQLTTFGGPGADGTEGEYDVDAPDWGDPNTPIVSVVFWSDYDFVIVTFPQSYLSNPVWREVERTRIAEVEEIRAAISTTARKVYRIREGEELIPEYLFDNYIVTNRQRIHKEPHVFAKFYWRGNPDQGDVSIVFPLSYLEEDWEPIEQALKDEER